MSDKDLPYPPDDDDVVVPESIDNDVAGEISGEIIDERKPQDDEGDGENIGLPSPPSGGNDVDRPDNTGDNRNDNNIVQEGQQKIDGVSLVSSSSMYDGLDEFDNSNGYYDYSDPAEMMMMRMEERGNQNMKSIISSYSSPPSTVSSSKTTIQYLPTFKAATGCTDASDFIVRCFVARLRAGITVVKYARSRLWWCKSHLRVMHIHADGCSLTWNAPASDGYPASGGGAGGDGSDEIAVNNVQTSSKGNTNRKLMDLNNCLEVRHAWSPDPQNPMYTGTPILRQKCEAANAHKSFALIFPKRTVDITACTADQCKVLIEGFSALCYRLQLHNASKGQPNNTTNKRQSKMFRKNNSTGENEDGISTTASATLTNTSKVT